jgi:hypothetical protein
MRIVTLIFFTEMRARTFAAVMQCARRLQQSQTVCPVCRQDIIGLTKIFMAGHTS